MAALIFRFFERLLSAPRRRQRLLALFLSAVLSATLVPHSWASDGLVAQDRGRLLAETGDYGAAVDSLQQAVERYRADGDRQNQALALRNLAYVYGRLGRWSAGQEAVEGALSAIANLPDATRSPLLARILDAQGHLYLGQGAAVAALQAWESSASLYEQLGDEPRRQRAVLTQTQALHQMGHYRQAIKTLRELTALLAGQPVSSNRATALHLLGESLRVAGELEEAEALLQEALAIATSLGLPQIDAIYLSLGKTAQTLDQLEAAQTYYRQAKNQSLQSLTAVQAQLGELETLIAEQRWSQAGGLGIRLQRSVADLPVSQAAVYAKISLAQNQLAIAQQDRLFAPSHQTPRASQQQIPATYTRSNLDLVSLFLNGDRATADETELSREFAGATYTRDNLDLVSQFLNASPIGQPAGRPAAVPLNRPEAPPEEPASTYTRDNLSLLDYFLGRQTVASQPVPEPGQLSGRAQDSVVQLLQQAQQDAQQLGDLRAESYALGYLGNLYERADRWQTAEALTREALLLAQSLDAPEIAYRWQWQLGRILKAEIPPRSTYQHPTYVRAVAAYSASVETLQTLRSDLAAINPEVQVAFQSSVEPIHRQLVSLLLADGSAPPENLEKARTVIESLQLAELDNFFREACLTANPVPIDQVDRQAAVIYPIILPERLSIIVRLPNQPLRSYSSAVPREELENTVQRLRAALVQKSSQRHLALSQQLYRWLLEPLAADLAQSQVKTLVFVSDGVLRNIPMAALHDGKQYLIENYGVATTPGLQLLEPTITASRLGVLAAGITKSRQGFPALPNVAPEIEQVETHLTAKKTLLDQRFTLGNLVESIRQVNAPVVHLATHGQFSSDFDETFILTWNKRLSIHQLREILQTTGLNQATSNAVELLVLSACETAAGDRQAALGLAGTAVRSGARSTLGSLWQVNDEATAFLISRFYQELSTGEVTKAEALRRAQMAVLAVPRFYQHPFFWAPYTLVGNWL